MREGMIVLFSVFALFYCGALVAANVLAGSCGRKLASIPGGKRLPAGGGGQTAGSAGTGTVVITAC